MPRRKPVQLEAAEQKALVEWFGLQYPSYLLFAIPNQLAWKSPNNCSGLVRGMPDLMMAVPRGTYAGLFIELKRPERFGVKAGKLSLEQHDILRHLNAAGYLALCCFGFDDAQRAIINYLES